MHQNPSQNLTLDTRRPRGRCVHVKTSCPILKSSHASLTALTGSGFQPIRLRSTSWSNIKTRSITWVCLETQPSFTRNIRCLLRSSESSWRPCSTRTESREWGARNGSSACKSYSNGRSLLNVPSSLKSGWRECFNMSNS